MARSTHAEAIQFFKCTNPDCGCMKVEMYDADGDCLAQASVPGDQVGSMLDAVAREFGFTVARTQ